MADQTIRKILTRDFILAFLAQFTLTAVFHLLLPTLPIYLAGLGSVEVEIGVLIGIFFLSSLVLRPFVGKALLKIPEKRFMIAGALLFALTSVAYLVAPPFWPFLVVRLVQGIGFAFFHTSSMTLIANISSGEHRGQSVGYFTLAMTLSGALGPSIGMSLINRFGFTPLFLVCCGLSVCSLIITTNLKKRSVDPVEHSSPKGSSFFDLKAIPPSIMSSFSLFMWGAVTAFFPLYAIHHGVDNPGLFFTTMAVMLILGRTFGGRILDLYRREKVILPCLITSILSMILLAFSDTLPLFILVAVIWGTGHAFLMPSLVAYALEREGSSAGPVMGTFTAISDLGISLGPVVMGIVIQSTSYRVMFLCLGLMGILNLGYFFFLVRKAA